MKPITRSDKQIFEEAQNESTRELVRTQKILNVFNGIGVVAVGVGTYLGAEVSDAGYLLAAGGAYLSYRGLRVSGYINDVLFERHSEPLELTPAEVLPGRLSS